MGKTLDDIVTDFKSTGNCKVDVDLVCDKWNHTWFLSQWVNADENEFTLCKQLRLGANAYRIKVTISVEQAESIIKKLNLDREDSMFRSGKTWRNSEIFHNKLRVYNLKRKKK